MRAPRCNSFNNSPPNTPGSRSTCWPTKSSSAAAEATSQPCPVPWAWRGSSPRGPTTWASATPSSATPHRSKPARRSLNTHPCPRKPNRCRFRPLWSAPPRAPPTRSPLRFCSLRSSARFRAATARFRRTPLWQLRPPVWTQTSTPAQATPRRASL